MNTHDHNNFFVSLGVVQVALQELLNSKEHGEHPETCFVPNCAVEDARKMLQRYRDDCLYKTRMDDAVYAIHLVRLHEALAALAMFTFDPALRNRARAIWFSTSVSARRATIAAADLLNEAVQKQMKALSLKSYPTMGQGLGQRPVSRRPMAVVKKER